MFLHVCLGAGEGALSSIILHLGCECGSASPDSASLLLKPSERVRLAAASVVWDANLIGQGFPPSSGHHSVVSLLVLPLNLRMESNWPGNK